jgi:hypothetical protein
MRRMLAVLILACGPLTMASAQPVDGSWEVRLPHTAGKRCGEDAIFRLTVAQGQLSGSFSGPRWTQPLRELAMNQDSTFSGETGGGRAAEGDPQDFINAIARTGAAILSFEVQQLMTTPIISCRASERVDAVLATMTTARIRHLPVIDGNELKGIVSIGDLVKHRLDEKELEASVLLDISRMRV